MKVQITELNKAYYDRLFDEMREYFLALNTETKNTITENNTKAFPDSIQSLPVYYEWLDRMRGLDNYDLFRIPVEEQEGYFDIDLNTRVISVPGALKDGNLPIRSSSFKENGLGVQGDHAAEVIYFRCARYFDNMDLALCQQNAANPDATQGACWIQWKRTGDITPHVSLAYNFDVNEDELIFGWVLGDEATETAGELEFSVRFVQWDPTADLNSGRNDPQELIYSLSTLSAKCKIHPSLTSQYKLSEITIEKNLNDLVRNRKIYSGIYQSTFGAYPVITSDGNLPLSANLQDYADGENGIYRYSITAYSPDGGTLSATWFQDIYGDSETGAQVIDPENLVTSVEEPETTGGNYTFHFSAEQAGSYYAVISNANTNGMVRNITSNGSTIAHASNFSLEEVIPPKAYVEDSPTYAVEAIGANGAEVGVPQNGYNGVSYQWYITPATGQVDETGAPVYSDQIALVGATSPEFNPSAYLIEHPAAKLDGKLQCEVINKRNKDTKTVRTVTPNELRRNPVAPICNIALNDEGKAYIDLTRESDMRDLSYSWTLVKGSQTYHSNEPIFAPWKDTPTAFTQGEQVGVFCSVTRKIFSGSLEKSATSSLSLTVQIP